VYRIPRWHRFPSFGSAALLLLTAQLLAPRTVAGQSRFTSVDDWKRQYQARSSGYTPRLLGEMFLPLVGANGLNEPFLSAGDKAKEDFLRIFVSETADAIQSKELVTPQAVSKYANPSSWAGQQYIVQYVESWKDFVRREVWADLLVAFQVVYRGQVEAQKTDAEKLKRMEALLLEFDRIDCDHHAHRSGTFFSEWRSFVQEYVTLQSKLGSTGSTPAIQFKQKEAACRAHLGMPG
jgi:hypothetical protein